ncbi:hypothetical protein PR048_031031 [Dryococelus australis]|uniref:XPG-I domain-containing protein n=1 Tax=Dryococelus australis TaxID=614101 RepID=A0ABQ9G449_9NEOP|nr:hypothetical protein PR048_031031 [Dryococelus australis]
MDLLWISGRWAGISAPPSWNGYMKVSMSNPSTDFHSTKVTALPFINMEPGNLSTINSALLFASKEECIQRGHQSCYLAFDQPLYSKAIEIATFKESQNLNNVIVRLGGFHILMFLGAIGDVMSGDGIEELFREVYAKEFVTHMIKLLQQLCWKNLPIWMTTSREKFQTNKMKQDDLILCGYMRLLLTSVDNIVSSFSEKSRTAKLWIEYYNQSDMVIEQNLMRSMKVKGVLISGRGFSDSVLTHWILSGPGCLMLCDALEKLCGISNTSSGNFSDVKIKRLYKVKSLTIMSRALKVEIRYNPSEPSLAMVLKSRAVTSENISADCKVVDGGYLLHALMWPRPATFDQICEAYVIFVQKHISLTETVVFDVYGKCATKGEERRWRSAGRFSNDISIAANNVVTSMQVDFLRNDHNKNGLIKLLVTYFRALGHLAIQCSGDADTTMAAIALQYDTNCGVKFIASDTDILAM